MATHKWKDLKKKMSPKRVARIEKETQKTLDWLLEWDLQRTLRQLKETQKVLRKLAKSLPDDDNYSSLYCLLMDTVEHIQDCFDPNTGLKADFKQSKYDAKKDHSPMPNHAKGHY